MAPTLSQNTQKLYETGAARKLGTVDEALCHRVLQEVKQQHRVGSKALYKGINTPDRRHDLALKMEGAGKYLVQQILKFWKHKQSPLYQPDAKLVEYACLISLPGSLPQKIHRDTQDRIQHKDAISFGIPLQNITPSMGPLTVRPTNGLDFFDVPAKTGEIYGWSQIVLHGGGANVSNTERWVLYFTVLYPPVLDIDVGGSYSLHLDYQPGLLLRHIISN
jgi:hypothetical protein